MLRLKLKRFKTQAVQKITVDENRAAGNPCDLMYHASSPDEKAIVDACRNYGVAFLGERENENGLVQYRLQFSLSSKTKKTVYERYHQFYVSTLVELFGL